MSREVASCCYPTTRHSLALKGLTGVRGGQYFSADKRERARAGGWARATRRGRGGRNWFKKRGGPGQEERQTRFKKADSDASCCYLDGA